MTVFTRTAPSGGLAGQARQRAHEILQEPRFRTKGAYSPDPLKGFLDTIDRWFHDLGSHISSGVHGAFGNWWPVVVFGFVFLAAAFVAALVVRRRDHYRATATAEQATPEAADPEDLEREAREAEAAGDHERAVRLRFRAGLSQLEGRGLVSRSTTRTSGDLRAELRSPAFDALADDLDGIVYGGVPATPADSALARDAWPKVPVEASSDRR